MSRAAIGAVLFAALGGCTLITDSFLTNDFSGDPFPVGVDTSTGAVVVGLRVPGLEDRPAVLDLLSPFTTIDPGTTNDPSLSFLDLTLLGKASDGALSIPRARFPEAQLLKLHSCQLAPDEDPAATKVCTIGASTTSTREFKAVLGADSLAGDAVRLRLADDQIFILPDIGGSTSTRTRDCDSVFGSPYRGGGTLIIEGTELPFGNRRIALQACLSPTPDASPQRARGTDVLFVVSTSIGPSILSESAYERYRQTHAGAGLLGSLPEATVYLPSGAISGRRTAVDRLALVATSSDNELAPCRQVYAHRVLAPGKASSELCTGTNDPRKDCPCEDGSTDCKVPAVLELAPAAGIEVLIVADTNATLQALRTELRPDQREIDGILGATALRSAEIDVDYPHDRLLGRCSGGECCARPGMTDDTADGDARANTRRQINLCLARQASCDRTPLPLSLPVP